MKQASKKKQKLINFTANILKKINGFPFEKIYGGQGEILMFHRILPDKKIERIWSNKFLEVTPNFLENTILYFKKYNFNFISINDVPKYINSINKKFVVFTFDDGYSDNYKFALPIFEKYNVPFTIYIATDFPNKKANLWWYKLEKLILSQKKIEFTFENKKFSYSDFSSIKEKNIVFEEIHNLIKNTKENKKTELFKILFSEIDRNFDLDEYVLSWEMIKELSANELVSIGAHTVTHRRLSLLTKNEVEREIALSKKILEEKINKKIVHFAYPFGGPDDFGEREVDLLKKYDFCTGVTTISQNVFHKKTKLLTIPRIACGTSMSEATFDLIRFGVIPMIRNKGKIIF
jgi:peptidoglycan/xylan/chitin deacetylase (PgdA/CDA1 family)